MHQDNEGLLYRIAKEKESRKGNLISMNIHGLYKLTLLDYPGHIACTLFTGGCNFRCPFCHNASLVTHLHDSSLIPEANVFSFLKSRIGILDGVCISGGEPTLANDMIPFIFKIKTLGFKVKLDTNGSNPDLLSQLIEQNLLDYVAMDIKNSPANYTRTIDLPEYDLTNINRSIAILINSQINYEFRTTVVKELHSASDFLEIAHWISNCSHYYLQSFATSKDLIKYGFSAYTKDEMISFTNILRPFIPNVEVRGIE
jgi:pyruvate formate lyase activating enzyme